MRFKLYSKERILQEKSLNANAWTVLGIVSGNDYSANHYGYGIVKNSLILKDETGAVPEIFSAYCKKVGCNENRFQNALQIFTTCQESFAQNAPPPPPLDPATEIWTRWESYVKKLNADQMQARKNRGALLYCNLGGKMFNPLRFS